MIRCKYGVHWNKQKHKVAECYQMLNFFAPDFSLNVLSIANHCRNGETSWKSVMLLICALILLPVRLHLCRRKKHVLTLKLQRPWRPSPPATRRQNRHLKAPTLQDTYKPMPIKDAAVAYLKARLDDGADACMSTRISLRRPSFTQKRESMTAIDYVFT